jgi:hypothetical protein
VWWGPQESGGNSAETGPAGAWRWRPEDEGSSAEMEQVGAQQPGREDLRAPGRTRRRTVLDRYAVGNSAGHQEDVVARTLEVVGDERTRDTRRRTYLGRSEME